MRLVFLGTGSGGSIQRFHTCIYVELADNRILLDASSGNSALVNASKLGLDLNTIHHLLLSHSHHDHSGDWNIWNLIETTGIFSRH